VLRELLVRSPLGATWATPAIFVGSLVLLLAWTLWHHDELPGIWLVALGLALNLLVAIVNGGRMPVAAAAASLGPPQLRSQGVFAEYAVVRPGTRLGWLGDWILLPPPLGRLFPQAYSPGDLVSFVGLAVVLLLATRPRRSPDGEGAITTR